MNAGQTPEPIHMARERDHNHHMLYQMLLIRRFEGKCAELYSSMKIRGFMHLYDGEEAVAVGVMQSLTADDAVVATYREHGHALARGISACSIMAEMYGKREGCSRGRGGSMHLFDDKTRFFGGNAIVGGGLPIAVGLALADKVQKRPRLTCCFFGEGAVAEGEFHESMNLAALWQLPVLFVCENNLYAMGTALALSESVTDITAKAAGYNIEAEAVDGMDLSAVEKAANKAASRVRSGKGPVMLECRTYRFRAHSMFDPELYRAKSEVEAWKGRCPIASFIRLLKEKGMLTDTELHEMEERIAIEIDDAVAFAEAGMWEPVEELTRFVYSDRRTE
ncbi:Pyruvate dehydrogenase E1 component subunit alpha [uncultured Desulfobacterium sp.]|uniref:Pyruvate dehydrogenase E1 component subunit alpha n=1 Tax=uncultured Desulfobacterium sp. TaxID=201089 RepID=A0A445MSV7_9BACT|nr:Pyruvate dehydrogenase E1 component subunit alpha [uncultured Desulfobacterium sp.]